MAEKLRVIIDAGRRVTERGVESPLKVFEPLLDLTLKEPKCLEKINKALERTGIQFPESYIIPNTRYKEVQHKITLVKNGESRCLLAFPLEILLWEVADHVAADGACEFFISSLCKNLSRNVKGWNRKLYIVLPIDFSKLPEDRRQGHQAFYRLKKFWETERSIEVKELTPELDFQDEEMVRNALSIEEKEPWELIKEMPVKYTDTIAKAIHGFPEWRNDEKTRPGFIDSNFPEFVKWTSDFIFTGGSMAVARQFIQKLINCSIEDRDNSLGIFVNRIKELGKDKDMDRDVFETLEEIIDKYQLEDKVHEG